MGEYIMTTSYTTQELFLLAEEYYNAHPEGDGREHVESNSPAQTYHSGVVDFLQWLANGKKFLYEPETYEDMDIEDLTWMLQIGAAENLLRDLDREEEKLREMGETND